MVCHLCGPSRLISRIMRYQHIFNKGPNLLYSLSTKRSLSCRYLKMDVDLSFSCSTLLQMRHYSSSHTESENMLRESDKKYTQSENLKGATEKEHAESINVEGAVEEEHTESENIEEDAKEAKPLSDPGLINLFGKGKTATEVIQNYLSKEDLKKLDEAKKYYIRLKQYGEKVPENVTDEMWLELIFLYEGKRAKMKRLQKYFYKENDKRKKQKIQELKKSKEKELKFDPADFNYRTIRVRAQDKSNVGLYERMKLSHAMMFGIPLIIDLDYEEHMRYTEIRKTAKQICEVYSINKTNKSPYHLIFCNASKGKLILGNSTKYMDYDSPEQFLCTVTEKHYLDLGVDPNRLVYLTPDTERNLTHFNPDDIYIIGGFVDTYQAKPVSVRKAIKDKIRCAKLPIDMYLSRAGNDALTLDQMIKIMLELKNTGNMEKAIVDSFPWRKVRKSTPDDESNAGVKKYRKYGKSHN